MSGFLPEKRREKRGDWEGREGRLARGENGIGMRSGERVPSGLKKASQRED